MRSNMEVEGPFRTDPEYLAWVSANQDSYVLNSNKSLTPRHTVIHRADCRTILSLKGHAKPDGFTRDYIKVGASSAAALRGWAVKKRADAVARECSECHRALPTSMV